MANSIRQFEDERKCRLKLERELSHMENRLRQQAKAECDAAALQGTLPGSDFESRPFCDFSLKFLIPEVTYPEVSEICVIAP